MKQMKKQAAMASAYPDAHTYTHTYTVAKGATYILKDAMSITIDKASGSILAAGVRQIKGGIDLFHSATMGGCEIDEQNDRFIEVRTSWHVKPAVWKRHAAVATFICRYRLYQDGRFKVLYITQ